MEIVEIVIKSVLSCMSILKIGGQSANSLKITNNARKVTSVHLDMFCQTPTKTMHQQLADLQMSFVLIMKEVFVIKAQSASSSILNST